MTLISRVDPDEYDAAGGRPVAPGGAAGPAPGPAAEPASGDETVADAVRRVTAAATSTDGRSPLDEAALLRLRRRGIAGGALWVAQGGAQDGAQEVAGEGITGFALADTGSPLVDVNLVVHPTARGAGTGRALADEVVTTLGDHELSAWSHGNHPAAARLAARLGFDRVRDLWVMRRPLSVDHPLPEVTVPGGTVVRTFERGRDEDAVLAVNAAAFARHPEQGRLSRDDLEERMAEPWFDPAGLFLAESAETGALLGFHWTKVHAAQPAYGEVYVVGIAPQAQGMGLGKVLTLTGLHHLRERGLGEVILYVEADNAPAVAVYSGLGFTHADVDTHVMYRRPAPAEQG